MISKKDNYDLSSHNTFRMKVSCRSFVEVTQPEDLEALSFTSLPEPLFVMGGGSNLLFTGDFPGTVLHYAENYIRVEKRDEESGEVIVQAGGGTSFDDLCSFCCAEGFWGAENLSLIPGEVGASAVQNIGAYGVEAKDVIDRVECVELQTGECRTFENAECRYAYRQSIFKQELRGRYAVTHVVYRLSKTFQPHLDYGNIRTHITTDEVSAKTVRQVIIQIRQEKLPDPGVMGNAGSFFVNPVVSREKFFQLQQTYPAMPYYEVATGVKIPAGWLIEQSGWKGRALEPAAVHDRQALVLVNRGGATGADILRLSDAVCSAVQEKFGISIHPEVNVI